MSSTINDYALAGYPAVAISTADEDRTIANVIAALPQKDHVWRIAATGGLVNLKADDANRVLDKSGTYPTAFQRVASTERAVLIVLDFQHIIRNAAVYRSLRDALVIAKGYGSMIVLVAPSWSLPAELEHDIPVINDSLPSRQELSAALDVCINSTNANPVDEETRTAILDAASGLTFNEAEGAIAMSFDGTTFDPTMVSDEKMKLVKNSGYLEVSAPAGVDDLGGLGNFRRYCEEEILPVIHDPELRVRGVMMVGVSGTGKSLASRVLAAILKRPILRCEIGALKGSHVGDSERKMREALKLAEAVSPIVLWFDEIEKGVGGYASSANTDSGVTLGMVGILLTWMQEHKSDIVIVATANNYSQLPAELTRAGRFDERFFVDLPTPEERLEIAAVHLGRYGVNGECARAVAEVSDGWTGAEIEQLVRSSARRSRKQITPDVLRECAKDIKPISKVRATEVSELRKWGNDNLRLANSATIVTAAPTGRRIAPKVAPPVAPSKSGMVINKSLN